MSTPLIERRVGVLCELLGVTYIELIGHARATRIVRARRIVWWVLRNVSVSPVQPSYPEIAGATGRPNHSTVITGMASVRGEPKNACVWLEAAYRRRLIDQPVRVPEGIIDDVAVELGIDG